MNGNEHHQNFQAYTNPNAAKLKFDADQQQLHSTGVLGLWRQISNLLILAAIIAIVVLLVRLF
ncbi:hypothetical protein [Paenibacillus humicus]|uniref:hypothetical protein n=1 Tax=Paenibacillus humicus TaxID=412861 RepID=UPI003D287E76